MPAAKTKADLIAVTEKEWETFSKLLADFDETSASIADCEGASAIRIVGHRAAWIDLYFAWRKSAASGNTPEMPAPGYKWNELNDLNEAIFQNQKGWTWSATCEALEGAHLRLSEDIHSASEAELYGTPLAPGLKWTRGRYAEAAGASHYRSAAKVLRKLMKQQ
ncbi:ClbS/DfsB family four-helix bundle protein [Pseudaestuariivita atlantica]|uniref:ClbS/DfsB family four-helix bundle protein n=1 Tax=Pseudaestuariivita atlantica TaxID=1317121 RepID=UPI0009E354BE|nr:ClbS/DfsB family four-helix bundle protein [Pseudaestuariivita atlantica]